MHTSIINNQKLLLPMIFKSMLGKVLEGLSNFSPVKNLIKYIIDRSLNELLSDQISLEDFKNGELFLTKLNLNLEKINKEYLLSSPYILHKGEVRRLKITLPSWSDLSTKSIEITAQGLHIDLKPNKQFVDNFKQAMREKQSDISQPQQPGGIDNPMDFFRQLVKQIILNMKIRVENSVIRLFINEPTKEVSAKPQYYLMFRLPLLSIGKNEDLIVNGKSEEVEEIKFDFIIPQMSLHLLKENAEFPEYMNQKAVKEDFPFIYPPVSHPSTIMLIGQTKNLGSIDREKSTKLTITLTTFFKKQRKAVNIQGKVNNFQASIDPIQLKIISRFFAQLIQFQKILKSVMTEMGLNPQIPNLNLSRRDSKGKSGNYDLFSSVMMSISEPSKPIPSAQINILNSMMQSPEMQKAATEFNENAVMQLRSSGDYEEGWKNINFKQEMTMRFQLRSLQANILKYVSASAYERKWSAQEGYERVNESLGCSHYRLVTLGLQYNFSSSKNQHEVKVRVVKLQDARLKNSLSFHQSVSQEFYDLDSSTFQNISVNQDYFTKQPELFPFRLYKEQHYCLQQLFQLSQGQDKQFLGDRVKTYAFMPAGGQCGQGAGLSINFNGHSKALIIIIKDVAVMVNFEIWKDVLNIVYPVFLYRKLYERMNMQTPELNLQEGVPKNFNMFESQYPIGGRLFEESQAKEQKIEVRVKVSLVYCFYRETAGLKTKQNLFEEVEKKILDSDNFSKQCFCGLNQKGIYAEIRGLEWQQMQEEFNLSIAEVKAGLISVVNSKTEQDVKPILIGEHLRVEQLKVEKKQGKMIETILKNRTYLPKVRFVVELPALISFIDMTKKVVAVVDSLQNFKKTLASKLLIIQQELSNRSRVGKEKVQKQRIIQCFVGEVELKMLLISTYLRGVFFRKKGGEQQLKLCSIAAGLAKQQDVRIGQFRNQLTTGQYPLTESYAGIRDTNLILEIGRGCKKNFTQSKASQPKSIRRLQKKLEFFQNIEKEEMNLWIIMKEKTESGQEKRQSREFKFDKARKNSVIEQEKKVKDISILPMQVYIHAGNLAFLLLHKKELEDIFNEVGLVMREIQEESRDIMERRGSIESQGEVTTQLSLNLKDLKLNIDIKPDYSYNPNNGQRILSNTRMFVMLELPTLKVIANPDSKQAKIDLNLNLSSYFLHYLDRDIQTNPLLLEPNSLAGLGFRKIAQLNSLVFKAELNGKAQNHDVICTIDSLKADLCLSTIPYLRLFLDHFTHHSLAGNYGSDDDSNFIILDNDPNEDLPEDLTQRLEQYERLLEEKKRVFNEFSTRPFQVRQAQGPKINLKKLTVNVVRVKLYGGNQFKFVQCNSENQSRACLRSRSEDPDLLNFLALTIENIRTRAIKGERQLQVLQELDRLELQLSYKRKEGFMWGPQKDFTMHLLKINTPIKIIIELNNEYSKFKLNTLEMTASLTDQVLSLAEQFQKAASACQKSAWKRHYLAEKVEQSGRKMLLAILPEGRITASAEYKRTKLLNERVLKLQELIIHEQSSNVERISKLFSDWAMTIFTSNLGTLISGGLFEVLSTCIGLLLGAVRQILAIFFPRLKD